MKSQDVFDYFGGVPNAARELGMTHQALYAWGDEVPRSRQKHVELATGGELKMEKAPKRKPDGCSGTPGEALP